jgi:hypothetical protein
MVLGWKGLPWTNTLVYYENPEITAVNCVIVQAPVLSIIRIVIRINS